MKNSEISVSGSQGR